MKFKSFRFLKMYFFLFSIVILFLCFNAIAQREEKVCPHEKESKERVEKEKSPKADKPFMEKDEFLKELNLSEDQKPQVDELFKTHREKIKTIMNELKEKEAPREKYQEALKNARADFDEKLAKILTDEQLAKYKEIKSDYSKTHHQKMEAPPQKLNIEEKLNLNEEQESQFDKINEKYKALHKELNDKMIEEIKGILTKEQLEKFEGLKKGQKSEKK